MELPHRDVDLVSFASLVRFWSFFAFFATPGPAGPAPFVAAPLAGKAIRTRVLFFTRPEIRDIYHAFIVRQRLKGHCFLQSLLQNA